VARASAVIGVGVRSGGHRRERDEPGRQGRGRYGARADALGTGSQPLPRRPGL